MTSEDVVEKPLWNPPESSRRESRMARFAAAVGRNTDDYGELWHWSVNNLSEFWERFSDWYGVRWHRRPICGLNPGTSMPGASWFPAGTLNYAEHALFPPTEPDPRNRAVSFHREDGVSEDLDWHTLRARVASVRSWLTQAGVRRGDRVAGVLPNSPHALIAMLATASLGAIWSSCSPDFGVRAVIDRFAQIEPRVLFAVDGYVYGGRRYDLRDRLNGIRESLASVEHTVLISYIDEAAETTDTTSFADLTDNPGELAFEPVPFDHPLCILYSSGTTGQPKPIVHCHGGILIEHAKHLNLHLDLGPGDTFFWFTTTGWMMWNLLMSGLVVGAGIVLYDGNPGWPDLGVLWDLAAQTDVTVFGVSAGFLQSCMKSDVDPARMAAPDHIKIIGSTGSPLPPESYRWIYDIFPRPVALTSSSGGTDICSAFVGGAPLLPVYEGRISGRMLGCKVESFDDDGKPVIGRMGELVVTEPMPSMPVGLWDDPTGARFRDTYFARFPGAWRHGDWVTLYANGTLVIHGRSDATLNRAGVRMGTSEFYSIAENVPGVADSLVIDTSAGGNEGKLLLFVVLAPGTRLDEVSKTLRDRIRSELSPRHVPDDIVQIQAVPRTLTGKKCEIPVKRVVTGQAVETAVSTEALANPHSMAFFEQFAAQRPR